MQNTNAYNNVKNRKILESHRRSYCIISLVVAYGKYAKK